MSKEWNMTALNFEVNQSISATLEACLQAEKQRITDEIRSYPPPIPACDAQFNYLTEQRDTVRQELSRLQTLRASGTMDHAELRNFTVSSASLDKKTKAQLLTAMAKEVSS